MKMEDGLGKRNYAKTGCTVVAAIFGLLFVIGALGRSGDDVSSAPEVSVESAPNLKVETSSLAGAAEAPRAANEPQDQNESILTGPQQNAVRNAQQYLDMTGFSRAGLIEQLSSEYGSGYSKSDATAAVDSLGVDWNAQAVRSAQSYLEMTGFSCSGLIEQLSSDAGSKYTTSEATYGAEQAGAC